MSVFLPIFFTARRFILWTNARCKKPRLLSHARWKKLSIAFLIFANCLGWKRRTWRCLAFAWAWGRALRGGAVARFAGGVIYYQSLFPDPEDLKSISAPLLCHYGTDDPAPRRRKSTSFATLSRSIKRNSRSKCTKGRTRFLEQSANQERRQSRGGRKVRDSDKSMVEKKAWIRAVTVGEPSPGG